MIDVGGRGDQLVDDSAALDPGGRGVGNKRADLRRCGRLAGEVERDTAQKAGIVHGSRRLNLETLELHVVEPVDIVDLRERRPDETGRGIQHGNGHRNEITLVADQQGGFADARAFHLGFGDYRREIRCVALDGGFAGHIAGGAVTVRGLHMDWCDHAGLLHEDLFRLDLQAGHQIRGGIAERDALRDPVVDGFVVARAGLETHPAAVRRLLGGLGQHEAARRFGAVEAAAGEIVKQRFVVEARVIAAQRQLEPVLAFGRAVASAGRAAHLVEDGRNIAQEGDVLGARSAGRA